MEKDVEEYLLVLNSERCTKSANEAKIILDKINQCLKRGQSQFTVSLVIALLLDEKTGVFSFIWKTSAEMEMLSSTTATFRLLEVLVTEFKECTQPYFSNLFENCLHLLNTKFAKVKELSLKLIKDLITAVSRVPLDLSKLVLKLDKYLREECKIPGTVSEQIYSVLGILFEEYPESIQDAKGFFIIMTDSLRREISSLKNPSVSRIKGAFEGINGYLVNYLPPDGETIRNIYGYVKKLSQFQTEKRSASRAALKLFQNHWKFFAEMVYDDRDYWSNTLKVWLKQNAEDRRCGFYAAVSYYRMITLIIKRDFPEEDTIKAYLGNFSQTLQATDTNSYEKRAALVGVKLFVLTDCLNEEDLVKTYRLVLDLVQSSSSFVSYLYLPLCIECVAAFVLKSTNTDLDRLTCLQRLSVSLISQYPMIDMHFQSYSLTALEKSFYMLGLKNLQVLQSHIDRVLYQGLIRTCSCMTVSDVEVLREIQEGDADTTTYKSYLSLWKYLLGLATTPILPVDGSFELKKGIATKVVDIYIISFIKVVSKLNFKVQAKDDSETELEAPSDIRIFINSVDLFVDLLPSVDPFNLQKWLTQVLQIMVELSYKHPQVAGFYKIITAIFKVANTLDYFDENAEDRKKCFELAQRFLQDILLKVDRFKNDLQIACLKTLLAAPVCLLEDFVEKTTPALEVVIRLGNAHFPLLGDALEALERWDSRLPPNIMSIITQKILPRFDVFFQSLYFQGKVNDEGKKLKKLVFKDSELLTLQKKFLLFLGNVNVDKAMHLIELQEAAEEEKKICDKDLIYYPPFSDGKPEINLDELLPRIVELALSCSDRSTRIAACELLYSIVMVILSSINQLNGGFTGAFRKVVKTCLMLGCDADNIINQIFEPLMFQIAHYFSLKKAMHFSETQDLIDLLMESVTRPHDPTAREFAAVLLCEFTIWSIKQLTPEELQVTPDSVNKVLNRIYSLSLHPDYNKRLGAAVTFNKIYSVLREENFILNAYWFQLYYHFMESLRMCDGPEDVTEIVDAIRHIKRPLVEKCGEFNEPSFARITPPEFEGNVLSDLVKWTLVRCHDVRTSTRRTAMGLVEELAPLVRDCDSLSSFARLYFPGKSFRVEFSANSGGMFVNWLNNHAALFEFYSWVVKHELATVDEVFTFDFHSISKKFITVLLAPSERSYFLECSKRQSVLSYLHYLLALKEKAYYFPTEVWELLKTCVFKPSECGFDLTDTNINSLSVVLVDLLRYFSTELTQYDWDHFYDNLESLITVPVLKHITKSRCVSVSSSEFLFGANIIYASRLWDVFTQKTCFNIEEGVFDKNIFHSLFLNQGRNYCAVSLEPSCKTYLEELLKLGLKVRDDLNVVMEFLEDSLEVKEEETGKPVKRGDYFLLQFKKVIYEFLDAKGASLIERVMNKPHLMTLLLGILQNGDQTFLACEVFRRWKEFVVLEARNKYGKKFLLRLVTTASSAATPGSLKYTPVADWICLKLEKQTYLEMDVDEIEAIFNLLPFLFDFAEDSSERLESCLSKFIVEQNVHKHCEDEKRDPVLTTTTGLLRALKLTSSLVVLRLLMKAVKMLQAKCKEEEVRSALDVFSSSNHEHASIALKLVYAYVFKSQKSNSAISLVFSLFLKPLLQKLPSAVVYDVVVSNLESLCKLILTPVGRENMNALKIELSKKIAASVTLQVFVARMSVDEIDAMPQGKRQFIDRLVKNCFGLIDKFDPLPGLKEEYRKFMCEVFNMIAGIISARCTDHRVYKLFVFDERGCFLYKTIDKDRKYGLGMEFDEIPKRKKFLTSLRKAITRDNQAQLGKTLQSVKYIQTNTLFSSSLAEDVTKFDLTNSPIRPIGSIEGYSPQEVELESDALNNHECMATLVGVIHKMIKGNINPEVGIPCWLGFFLAVLRDPGAPENLKLLVLKAMYNVQDYLKLYAEEVFVVVLEAVHKLFKNAPINYFLIDLIEMMVAWRYLPTVEVHRRLLTELVKTVISKSDAFRRDIVKHNLEVLKTMVEVWKGVLFVSSLLELVSKRLSESVAEDVRNNFAVDGVSYLYGKVCGILLSNEIPSWKHVGTFFDTILNAFHDENRNKELFAEVCGLALGYLQKVENKNLSEYENRVRVKISSQPVSELVLLYGVHKHYPKIVVKFVFKIFTTTWRKIDSFTAKNMEMLLSYATGTEVAEDDTFERHAHLFLADMLNTSDLAVQELGLQLAEKMYEKLVDSTKVVKESIKLQNSIHPTVRKWVYEIAMKFYLQPEVDSDVQYQCKVVLLRGLSDGVRELEESCLNFWRKHLHFSSAYFKFLAVLREMYTPETENAFLKNAMKVLMESASTTEQYDQPIFPYPITTEGKFQKRSVILGLRKTVLTGCGSKSNQSLECMASLKSQNHSYLKDKVSTLKFEPTMQNTLEMIGVVDVEENQMPRNPFRKRFYKSAEKTKNSYVLRRLANNRKKSFEEEEERKKQKTEVTLFGEYRTGDYPDIQINHSQFLQPLEALAKKDPKIARQFLASVYSGLTKVLAAEERGKLLSETNDCFDRIFKTSTSFDPGLFGFVFQILLTHRNVEIDCEQVSRAAVASNWPSLGVLLIEQIISEKENEEEADVAKRRKGSESLQEKRWLELARLYRNLKELDILPGIFLDKLHVEGDAREAVRSEALQNWASASKWYEATLEVDSESAKSEFYSESYFSCLAKLSDWSSLNDCIRKSVDDVDELWGNHHLLSWFLKSDMMIRLTSKEKETLEDFYKKNTEMLSVNFGEELAVLDWLLDKLQKASYRIDRLCLDFLASWSHLNQWSYNLRETKLTNLQTLSELHNAVKTLADKSRQEQFIKSCAKRWERNMPSSDDDLMIWDVKLTYRRRLVNQLNDPGLNSLLAKSNLSLARAAIQQSNLGLAKEYLSRVGEQLPEVNEGIKSEHEYYLNLGKMALARMKSGNGSAGLNIYVKIWRGISKQMAEASSEMENYRCNLSLGRLVSEILPSVEANAFPEALDSLRDLLHTSSNQIEHDLKSQGLEYLEAAKNYSKSLDRGEQSNSYLELAKYLLKFSELTSWPEFEKLVQYTLKAMSLGNAEARELFGCVLNKSQFVIELSSVGTLNADSVPSWMFLMWLNQILACLNTQLFPFLKDIVYRITVDYPNAVRYPFHLNKANYTDPKLKSLLRRLEEILYDKIYECFLKSMNYLAPPHLILRYHLDNILREVDQTNPKYDRVRSILSNLHELMYSQEYDTYRGPVFRFWEKFKAAIEGLMKLKNEAESWKRDVKKLLSSVENTNLPSKRTLRVLESYSPWLRNFHSLKCDAALELPGQYDMNVQPLKKYLVTIVSFRYDVLVFDSKCRPMRIGILGNDAAEHGFLVKFGEDLRQDQRIQQVFRHFNDRLRNSKEIRHSVNTFKVIPLTSNLGMIEWIHNNVSLHDMLESSLGGDEAIGKAQNEHLAFLAQGSAAGVAAAHLLAYEKMSRMKAITGFNQRVHSFPRDLLKKCFWNVSTSPEHFFHLRSNFATSHAVMCVTHWLVGIGDRHLQNILLSTKTGRVLGIDFGYAFGFATQFLTPPELIPFRLTPQILNLTHPLNESGWIKQTMIHCLRLFRKEHFVLLSILEVFVLEPVVDWLYQAKKNNRSNNSLWYPREKISLVHDKLRGVNPVVLFEKDLQAGHSDPRLRKYLEVVRGVEQFNARARYGRTGLSEEEQVDCLIDLATDPHILSKTYIGWNPWL